MQRIEAEIFNSKILIFKLHIEQEVSKKQHNILFSTGIYWTCIYVDIVDFIHKMSEKNITAKVPYVFFIDLI